MGLFSRETRTSPSEVIENIIGPSANVKGTIQSDGGVRIDGLFEGTIEVAGNVIIGEGARVAANITARNVTVGGAVKGNIDGTGRLEILTTGQVFGDICVASVLIDEGGTFQGVSRIRGHEQRALPGPGRNADPFADAQTTPTHNTHATHPDSRKHVAKPKTSEPVQSEIVDVHIEPPRPTKPPATSGPVTDFDFGELDIEPTIPDVVIEDVTKSAGGPPQPRPQNQGHTTSNRPSNRRR